MTQAGATLLVGFTIQGGQSQDRDIEFLGERLQVFGDSGDLLLPHFLGVVGCHELGVVHNDELQAILDEPTGLADDVAGLHLRPIIDHEIPRGDVRAHIGQLAAVVVGERARP